MNRGENSQEKPARAKEECRTPAELSRDLAVTTRLIFGLNRRTHAVPRASLCQRAARLHYELSREERPSVRRHRQERALALLREALALTNPAHRYHRATLMLQSARLYRNLDRDADDRSQACRLMANAAILFLKIRHTKEAQKIADEARELADEYGIPLVFPKMPPPPRRHTAP